MLHLAITKSATTTTTPLFTETLIPSQKKLYSNRLLKNRGVRTHLVRQRPRL